MVWFRWHAAWTVKYEYFTPSLVCVKRKSWSIYKYVHVPMCRPGKRHNIHKWLPHTPLKHYIRPKEFCLLTLDGSVQWWIALSWSRLAFGSEFSSHGQLLYGPCMSSLTAAVFTSRLDWYGQTSCCPATVSSALLVLSSRPYVTLSGTTRPLERFKHLDCVEVVTGSAILLLSPFCDSSLKTQPCACNVNQRP